MEGLPQDPCRPFATASERAVATKRPCPFFGRKPVRGQGRSLDGTRMKTTKVFISNLPISFSNDEIENKLISVNCKPMRKLIDECDRDDRGKLTRWKTGRRFIFIVVPSSPLPAQISMGSFTASIFHKEQKTQAGFRSNCLQSGHRKHECVVEIVCRLCKQSGHKSGEALCDGAAPDSREVIPTEQINDAKSHKDSSDENENEAVSGDDDESDSTSNEGTQMKKEKLRKRKEKEGKGSGSSEEERKSKMPNHNASPAVSNDKRLSDTDSRIHINAGDTSI